MTEALQRAFLEAMTARDEFEMYWGQAKEDRDKWKARAEAAEKVLAALVLWKDYKDAHGKDATYEAGKDEAWASARAALEPKPTPE